jgi:diketogulonate reductase-like aldo/keto reductase
MQITLQVWAVLESYVPHRIRTLGICNVNLPILRVIYALSTIEPSVVQNPLTAASGYDKDVRQYCSERGIQHQGFWALTGNRALLETTPVKSLAVVIPAVAPEVALYALFMGLGINILNGTSSKERLVEDLRGVTLIKQWARANRGRWESIHDAFLLLIKT